MTNPVKKVIIVGNDKHTDKFDYNRILNSKLSPILVGVNRFFYLANPHYLFFHDIAILKEMMEHNIDFSQFNILTTNWLEKNIYKQPEEVKNKIEELKQSNIMSMYKRKGNNFPDSVNTAIRLLNNQVYKKYQLEFYILGVSLKWDNNKSHFWKGQYETYNNKNHKWYERRFKLMLNNFRELKNKKYTIYSSTPNSELNKIFPYKRIEYFYE